LCLRQSHRVFYPSVRLLRYQSREHDKCFWKKNEAILLQTDTTGQRGEEGGLKRLNFGGQEVKSQGHTTPKLDLEGWQRQHFLPFSPISFRVSDIIFL